MVLSEVVLILTRQSDFVIVKTAFTHDFKAVYCFIADVRSQ